MIALTSLIHVTGLISYIYYAKAEISSNFEKAKIASISKTRAYFIAMRILLVIVIGIVVILTFEIWLWAILYILIGEFETVERALYFSTVTFTTLGYGDTLLNFRWQLLSSLEAMNGVILFGLSTGFAFTVMHRIFDLIELLPRVKPGHSG